MICHCRRAQAVMPVSDTVSLCVDCWTKIQNTQFEAVRLKFAEMNHLSDHMAWSMGLPPGPHIEIPSRTYAPVTMNTTNNIRVEKGSQVGQLNAGALNYLNQAVSTLNAVAGGQEFAAALQAFSQATVDNKELDNTQQREVLNLLQELVEQVNKPKEARNPSIARLALNNIGAIVNVITALGTHWAALKAFFEQL
jgi:hypothetical protein